MGHCCSGPLKPVLDWPLLWQNIVEVLHALGQLESIPSMLGQQHPASMAGWRARLKDGLSGSLCWTTQEDLIRGCPQTRWCEVLLSHNASQVLNNGKHLATQQGMTLPSTLLKAFTGLWMSLLFKSSMLRCRAPLPWHLTLYEYCGIHRVNTHNTIPWI